MIKIREWKANEIKNDMAKYHWMPVYKYWTSPEGIEQAYNREEGSYTFEGEIVAESEKAYKIELETETEGFRATGKAFRCWIPKSVVLM